MHLVSSGTEERKLRMDELWRISLPQCLGSCWLTKGPWLTSLSDDISRPCVFCIWRILIIMLWGRPWNPRHSMYSCIQTWNPSSRAQMNSMANTVGSIFKQKSSLDLKVHSCQDRMHTKAWREFRCWNIYKLLPLLFLHLRHVDKTVAFWQMMTNGKCTSKFCSLGPI